MNRFFILIILIIMFLSCGNSSTEAVTHNVVAKPPTEKITLLSKEQKLIANKLDETFSNFNRQGSFNGSILVSKGGKIIYNKSLGYSNKSTRSLLTDSSMYQLASVSKVITATAILILYEREQVDLNKPLKYYLPDFPYEGVLVKHLLSHRSGIPNYIYTLYKEIYQPNYRMNNTDMYNYFISKNTRRYLRPNYRFNYCNTNYALLGLLIEKISGKSYTQFLKDELFTPLGMKNTTTIWEIDENNPKTTKPYDNRWRPVAFDASDYVLGDKSIYSTAYDLYLFSEALYQNKIIKAETQQMAYTAFSKEVKLSNYGYGWRMKNFRDPSKKEVYHNGWWHGYRSAYHRRLKDTLTIVILSNQLNHSAYHAQKVYEIIDSNKTIESGADEDDD